MDLADLAILRELAYGPTFQWDVRVSYAEVGRRVGLDEETVRARIRRMQDAGVITRWTVALNPRVLGRGMAHVGLPLPSAEAKERVLEALRAMEGVVIVFDRYGPSLGVVLMHEPGKALERQLALLAALGGTPEAPSPVSFPPPAAELGRADWRIVQALRRDARRSYAELAAELGLSERTVRRRVEWLTRGHAVYLIPRVDLTRMEGWVTASVHVACRDAAARGAVEARLRGLHGLLFQWYEGNVARVSLGVRNVAEIEALRRELAALPGVERAGVEILLRRIDVDAWLDEVVARHAEDAG